MNTVNSLRAAEAMREAAANLAAGDIDNLRHGGESAAANAYQSAAQRIRAIDADALLSALTGQVPNPDEIAAFEAAAKTASFNVQRRDDGSLFHPITQRVHSVWRAAVNWAQERALAAQPQAGAAVPSVEHQALTAIFHKLDPHRDAVLWGIASEALGLGKLSELADTGIPGAGEEGPLVARLLGRAKYLREQGGHKSASLMEEAAAQLARQRQGEPVGEYVGGLFLGGIDGNEHDECEADPSMRDIEALQKKLVTTSEPVRLDLYAVPRGTTPAAAQSAPAKSDDIAAAIHYPECWDTAAYPSVEVALGELYHWFKCSNSDCARPAAAQAAQGDAVRDDDLPKLKKRLAESLGEGNSMMIHGIAALRATHPEGKE